MQKTNILKARRFPLTAIPPRCKKNRLNWSAANLGSLCKKLGGLGALVREEIYAIPTVQNPKLKFIYRCKQRSIDASIPDKVQQVSLGCDV
jgi:hypothetical protein